MSTPASLLPTYKHTLSLPSLPARGLGCEQHTDRTEVKGHACI